MTSEAGNRRPSPERVLAVLLAVYWSALFVGTHVRLPQLPAQSAGSDKVLHVVGYGGLGLLLGLWVATRRPLTGPILTGLFVLLAVYGGVDEWLQQFVNRHADRADWYADLIGGGLGLLCAAILHWVRPPRRRPGKPVPHDG